MNRRLFCGAFCLLAQQGLAQVDCGNLQKMPGLDLLPDAPTQLTETTQVAGTDGLPGHCQVRGYVAPQVQFELRLPTDDWNGKLLVQGCGGLCGGIRSATCDDALARHYAVVTTDMGHQAPAYQSLWALDNRPAEIDFAYRATHVVTVAAKALVENFYGEAHQYAYFRGCSTGGRQGLISAQRFPRDFDGIIAGAPVLDETATAALHLIWSGRANLDDEDQAILTPQRVHLIHELIVNGCDPLDGQRDGIIQDPRLCDWEEILPECQDDSERADCFVARERLVLRRLYGGATDSSGVKLVPGGVMPGSEYEWVPNFVGRNGPAVFHPDGPISQLYQTLIFFHDPGPGHSAREFDFDHDPPRLALVETLYSARNPDLRKFRDRGGRLIIYQGWDDVEVTPLNTIDYFEMMTRTMGGTETTADFARLFMMPGVAHCRRGPGADTVDWLGYLEQWVEGGEAPAAVEAYHLATPQNYLGLPRPRFPLADGSFDRMVAVRAYAVGTGNPP